MLASREVGQNHLFTSNLDSPLLIPFSGKPIFLHYERQFDAQEIIYAVNENAKITQELISHKNPQRKFIKIPTEIADSRTGDTLLYCLELLKFPSNVLVLYGDNVYKFKKFPSPQNKNIIYTSKFVDVYDSYSYFLIQDDKVSICREKQTLKNNLNSYSEPKLNTGAIFFSQTSDIIKTQNVDIIELLSSKKFFLEYLDSWRDIGHQDLLFEDDSDLDSREFNTLLFSKDKLSIVKKSLNSKLKRELEHLEHIPKPFTFLFPRVERDPLKEDEYAIEFWPLRPLSEYLCFWKLHDSVWQKVLTKVLDIVLDFRESESESIELQQAIDARDEIFLKMFLDRISRVPIELSKLMSISSFVLNGVNVEGIPKVLERFKLDLLKVGSSLEPSFYHGDLCLSNILYSPEEHILKFIDPKGSMFDHSFNLGDIRYDLAKLLHSLLYGYDFVNYELSQLRQISDNTFHLNLIGYSRVKSITKMIIDCLEVRFSPEIISASKIITAMLFFTMLPLHQDSLEKQKSFFLIGLTILNEIYCDAMVFDKVFN